MNCFQRATATFLSLLLFATPTEAGILAGPYLQNPTPTSITIRWISDASGTSVVEYGRPDGPGPLDSGNLALKARASASSENTNASQTAAKAIDGSSEGYPGDYRHEWTTLGQGAGAWLQLEFNEPVLLSTVVLYDRPNLVDQILAGELSFSDGSTVNVGKLNNNGAPVNVAFSPRTVTWLRFRVLESVGHNIGLAEIEARAPADSGRSTGSGTSRKFTATGPNGTWYSKLGSYLHEVAITDLTPNSRYAYRVKSNGTHTSEYTFKTAPPSGSPISFLAISDAQMKPDLPMTVEAIGKLVQPDLIIFSGDLIDEPDRVTDWHGGTRSFFDVFTGRQGGVPLLQNVPLFPSLGNHEYGEKPRTASNLDETASLETYMALFNLLGNERYYSHDYGNTHFLHLNIARQWTSNPYTKPQWILGDAITVGSPQYKWLVGDLNQNRQPWTVVSFHQPMMGQGNNTSPPFCDPVQKADSTYEYPRDILYNDLRPLLEKYSVDLVIWGHSHVYEHYHVNGVHYMEASCIGNTYGFPTKEPHGLTPVYQNTEDRSFAFVQADDAKMTITAYKAKDGSVLESFEIRKGAQKAR